MELKSSAFGNNEKIPEKYTCDGMNVNPPLQILDIPDETESLVLIMEDPDIPKEIKEKSKIEVFNHWVVFDILPDTTDIPENTVPHGVQGLNSANENRYFGPCPPKNLEPKEHRYFFKLYALNTMLNLPQNATRIEVERAMQEHILEKVELVGRYERK